MSEPPSAPSAAAPVAQRTGWPASAEPAPRADEEPLLPMLGRDEAGRPQLDEGNVRANFAFALGCIGRGEEYRAEVLLGRILDLGKNPDAPLPPEQKHLFNDLGILLRKKKAFAEALRFYETAKALSPEDGNLHHNMARALYEKGELREAVQLLKRSLELDPELRESRLFLRFLEKRLDSPGAPLPRTQPAKPGK